VFSLPIVALSEKVKTNMTINTHTHSGWNNDDSSHYDGTDLALDLDRDTLTITHEIEGWHSNSGSYGPTRETTTRAIVPLSWNNQNEVYATLAPFISTANKYPHLRSFKFFSVKHQRFLCGRLAKAHVDLSYGRQYFTVEVKPIIYASLFDYELFED
jgi:hypothetical protein